MASAPLTVKLRCSSWKQLAGIYRRDLTRGALFLKTVRPPPMGTEMRVDLTLPSETLIVLRGAVRAHVPPGGLDGRGPGVDVQLEAVPQSAMWLIESALSSADREESGPVEAPAAARAPAPGGEPTMEESEDIASAEGDLVAALASELESLRKLNAFQVLGVGYDTSDEIVRSHFGELTRRYHPDRFARYQSAEAREYASEIFIVIRDAYRRLHDAPSRARTLAAMRNRAAIASAERRAASRPAPAERTPPPSAERTPRRAPTPPPAPPAAKLGRDIFEPASRTTHGADPVQVAAPAPARAPASGDEHTIIETLLDNGKYEEAIALFRIAVKRDPGDRRARVGLELAEGMRALAGRDRLEAAQRFEAVLELDPTNERAARELAEMRRQATNERKGLLARLLGTKE